MCTTIPPHRLGQDTWSGSMLLRLVIHEQTRWSDHLRKFYFVKRSSPRCSDGCEGDWHARFLIEGVPLPNGRGAMCTASCPDFYQANKVTLKKPVESGANKCIVYITRCSMQGDVSRCLVIVPSRNCLSIYSSDQPCQEA